MQKQELEEIIDCISNGRREKNEPFPEAVRSFCMSIHYYSPRTYMYLREKFNNHLPHPSTMRLWLNNSNIDIAPGVLCCALDVVQNRAQKMQVTGKKLICNLVFDEMAIRKNIQWCQRTRSFAGYCTFGAHLLDSGDVNIDETPDEFPVANQSIVFMLSGVNDYFQIPIAYYFIRSLDAEYRVQLVNFIIEEVTKRDIRIVSVTFDGYASNASMCKILGADLKLAPRFLNQNTGETIDIILDPSHAEKLVRGILADYKTIYDGNNEQIEWQYFVELVDYSQNHSFGITHKVTKRHINFENRKMHVRTAVELLSNSVANAIEYLMKLGVQEFKGAAATIKFIRIMDKLFDVMNSSRIVEKNIYKSALNPSTKAEIFKFLAEAKTYISSLEVISKMNGKRVKLIDSSAKTGFRGYVMNILSVMSLYSRFVEGEKIMSSLNTYRLSQDHLEMTFGRIRSMNGCNDNPTSIQFQSALRKLLHKCDIRISSSSNVAIIGCASNVLTVTSRRAQLYDDLGAYLPDQTTDVQDVVDDDELHTLEALETSIHVTELPHLTSIAFVANIIENRLLQNDKIACELCVRTFKENEKVDSHLCLTEGDKPCKSTFQLCKSADTAIRTLSQCSTESKFKQQIYIFVLSNMNINDLYVLNFENEGHDVDHKNYLIKHIIDEYTRIRCTFLAKMKTLRMHKEFVRNKLRKVVHVTGL